MSYRCVRIFFVLFMSQTDASVIIVMTLNKFSTKFIEYGVQRAATLRQYVLNIRIICDSFSSGSARTQRLRRRGVSNRNYYSKSTAATLIHCAITAAVELQEFQEV